MKTFPNGFSCWQETHFEVVSYLVETSHHKGSLSNRERELNGLGGLYELAEELTDDFENLHKDRLWDGDFLDVMDTFLNSKV